MINSFTGEYRWLSNFWLCPVTDRGITFPSAENAFQAMKCVNPEDKEQFVKLTPFQSKKVGRKVQLVDDWDRVRVATMRAVVRAKFSQNTHLMAKLLATNGQLIEGNTWGDTFWGVCRGKGQNHLGKILMSIRGC